MKTIKIEDALKLENTIFIDVRTEKEYQDDHILNAYNMPLFNNDEYCEIGTIYKKEGKHEAIDKGFDFVSKKLKDMYSIARELSAKYDHMVIYCARGGMRSGSVANLLTSIGIDLYKLEGGYKEFRNYLINALDPCNIYGKPIVLTGYTGSGKTEILKKVNNAIDLEGIANHRGSAFGGYLTPQPTQINFENNLAYEVIKHIHKGYKHIIIEDEGKNIGKSFIPTKFYEFIHNGNVVLLDSTLEERINNILNDYVILAQKQYIDFYNNIELGMQKWYENIESSMLRLKQKLGGSKLKIVLEELRNAFKNQCSTNDYYHHTKWIELFLVNYYDPMYKHSISKDERNIIYKGNKESVLEFLESLR